MWRMTLSTIQSQNGSYLPRKTLEEEKKGEPRKIPLLFPWKRSGDVITLNTDMHLHYPNALQPDKWVRESSGEMAQVSEMMRYFVQQKLRKSRINLSQLYGHME